MRLNDDLYVLALPFVREGQSMPLNLCLLVDAVHGPTLVDAGLPGQQDAIAGEVALAGVQVQQLKRIVLTHQDIDDVGSLPWLARTSGAQVLAYEVEAPFIDGSATPRFAAPEVLARRPEMRAVVEQMQPIPIDKVLRDGDTLDVSGGVRVVATPGHTVGHVPLPRAEPDADRRRRPQRPRGPAAGTQRDRHPGHGDGERLRAEAGRPGRGLDSLLPRRCRRRRRLRAAATRGSGVERIEARPGRYPWASPVQPGLFHPESMRRSNYADL